MTSAYDKAQIEQLDMRLSQMIDDCALMKVEIGLLRAGRPQVTIRYDEALPLMPIDEAANLGELVENEPIVYPGESWQTEDVGPVTEDE